MFLTITFQIGYIQRQINNLLDYAFTLGHEMIHVFDFTYNHIVK